MLNKLKIKNFKAWHEVEIEFGKITGFFGANSAGKSSLIQFLLMLKQTKNATDRGLVLDFGGPAGLVNLGTYVDVVCNHEMQSQMSWNLAWKLPKELKIDIQKGVSGKLSIKSDSLETWSEVCMSRDGLGNNQLGYKFDEAEYRLKKQESSKEIYKLDTNKPKFSFLRNKGRRWPLGSPIKTHLFPDEIKWLYQNADFLNEFEKAYEEFIDSIYYLGPLREQPKREYQWAGSSPNDVGPRGERTIDAILAARRDGEKRNFGPRTRYRDFEWIIARWLQVLGLIQDFQVKEIADGSNLYRVYVKKTKSSPEALLTDVGFGVSQVLPVLVLLYYVPKGSTILMEQPEIHLHPAVQSELADVMVDVIKSRDIQIIVESHSEHFLRRLQLRVAENKKVSHKDIKLLYFAQNKGKAIVSDLSLNQWGEIENWPREFFGNAMEEIAEIAEYSLERKINQLG
ncbi:MAG: DUF3696 domain-containing protein [Gammaproteobacteria bacterium]|nr:DUF3696 domain-containing protein [Gammaproteobacteria bacterium]